MNGIRRAVGWVLLGVLVAASPLAAGGTNDLAQAQELLDAGQVEPAVTLLDGFLARYPGDPQALLLRSTGRFILGLRQEGKKDLDDALELDPTLRQGWLNRAAVDLSERRYEDAYQALLRARDLDPSATDNHLNLGAVLLLMGRLEAAGKSFSDYLSLHTNSAQAYYLVASNYSLAGYAALALEHLKRAVTLDEKTRMQARTDPNFTTLAEDPRLQQVLNTDSYRPPAGYYVAGRDYPVAYDAGGTLLAAVLDALTAMKLSYEPRIESAPQWALIWGELRIRVGNTPDGLGRIDLSARPDQFPPRQWQALTESLFRQVSLQLALRTKTLDPAAQTTSSLPR